MALTDLLDGVRRLARPLALGLAVYGCGEDTINNNYYGNRDGGNKKSFCDAYFERCPPENEEDYAVMEGCQRDCKVYASPRDQPFPPYYICPILACGAETGYCEANNPQVIACLDQYGWCDNPEFSDYCG